MHDDEIKIQRIEDRVEMYLTNSDAVSFRKEAIARGGVKDFRVRDTINKQSILVTFVNDTWIEYNYKR